MKPFLTYTVQFIREGDSEPRVQNFKAANAGDAQAKCLREYPDARVLRATREGRLVGVGGWCHINYEAVSTTKVELLPGALEVKEMTFPFYDNCIGHRLLH
jgi:hypothetical protein